MLAQHFLRLYAAKNNRPLESFSEEALGCLEAYPWPGNVRELENVVERAVVLARGASVEAENLPDYVTERPVMLVRAPVGRAASDGRRGGVLQDPRGDAPGRRRAAAPGGDAPPQPGQQDADRQDARHRSQDRLPQAQGERGGGERGRGQPPSGPARAERSRMAFTEIAADAARRGPHRHPQPAREAQRADPDHARGAAGGAGPGRRRRRRAGGDRDRGGPRLLRGRRPQPGRGDLRPRSPGRPRGRAGRTRTATEAGSSRSACST